MTNKKINSLINTDSDETQYCAVADLAAKIKKLSNFIIMHINIRSIHANIEKLDELLTSCNVSPDVIALSETKLKQQQTFNMTLEGYNLFKMDPKIIRLVLVCL